MKPSRKTSRQPTAEDLSEIRKLRDLRRSGKKSQAWVAEHAGVSAQQWGKYERGEDRIPVGRYRVVLAALQGAAQGGDVARGFGEAAASYDSGDFDDPDAEDIAIMKAALERIEMRRRQRR